MATSNLYHTPKGEQVKSRQELLTLITRYSGSPIGKITDDTRVIDFGICMTPMLQVNETSKGQRGMYDMSYPEKVYIDDDPDTLYTIGEGRIKQAPEVHYWPGREVFARRIPGGDFEAGTVLGECFDESHNLRGITVKFDAPYAMEDDYYQLHYVVDGILQGDIYPSKLYEIFDGTFPEDFHKKPEVLREFDLGDIVKHHGDISVCVIWG